MLRALLSNHTIWQNFGLKDAIPGARKASYEASQQGHATTYRVRPGFTLFLDALARFDYETIGGDNDKNLLLLSWYSVLPGHLTSTERKYALTFCVFPKSDVTDVSYSMLTTILIE